MSHCCPGAAGFPGFCINLHKKITPKESVGTWFGIVVGIRDLGVGDDVVVVVAEAAGAPHELAEDDVAERIAAPPLRVPSGHPLRLLPALLLHRVREAPGLRRGRRRRRQQQLVQVGGNCRSGGRGGGERAWGTRASRGAEGLRRRLPVTSAASHRLPTHHCYLVVVDESLRREEPLGGVPCGCGLAVKASGVLRCCQVGLPG